MEDEATQSRCHPHMQISPDLYPTIQLTAVINAATEPQKLPLFKSDHSFAQASQSWRENVLLYWSAAIELLTDITFSSDS